jgi:inositol hexakisphosphate/diphosphoinositol-pentakisphosphate kinase
MRHILDRLISNGDFEAIIFGDKVILDEDVEKWPYCDFLISFFSKGFPLQKAIAYVELFKPFCVNDLPMQHILWDRRLVLELLDAVGIPTLPRLFTGNDFPPLLPQVQSKLKEFGVPILEEKIPRTLIQLDNDTIQVGDQILKKPFVEKPVSGEDHNVYIYYAEKDGGGVRKLFRKASLLVIYITIYIFIVILTYTGG